MVSSNTLLTVISQWLPVYHWKETPWICSPLLISAKFSLDLHAIQEHHNSSPVRSENTHTQPCSKEGKKVKNSVSCDRGRICSVVRPLDCRAKGRGFDTRDRTQGLKTTEKWRNCLCPTNGEAFACLGWPAPFKRYLKLLIKSYAERKGVACENSRFSSLFAAEDVSRGGTSATQRQKFHTDDVKSVPNPVISADWTTE